MFMIVLYPKSVPVSAKTLLGSKLCYVSRFLHLLNFTYVHWFMQTLPEAQDKPVLMFPFGVDTPREGVWSRIEAHTFVTSNPDLWATDLCIYINSCGSPLTQPQEPTHTHACNYSRRQHQGLNNISLRWLFCTPTSGLCPKANPKTSSGYGLGGFIQQEELFLAVFHTKQVLSRNPSP